MKTNISIFLFFIIFSALAKADSGRRLTISAENFELSLNEAIENAKYGDVIEMPAGRFEMKSEVVITKHGIQLVGQGKEKTVLSFRKQLVGAQGVFASADRLVFSDFAVEDSFGNAVKVVSADTVTFRNLIIRWTDGPKEVNGAYGLYPVSSRNVLIEGCEVSGASDAGIYVGQSENIIVRKNKAFQNVAGIEIENSKFADVYENDVYDNTAGILVFNLPNLPVQGGRQTRVYNNLVRHNNLKNFSTEGSIIHLVPPGLGIFIMANSEVEIFKNKIIDHYLTGIAVSHYAISERKYEDPAYDPMPKRLYIYQNELTPARYRFFDFTRMNTIIKLLLGFKTPEIIYDGIEDGTYSEKKLKESERICIQNNVTSDGKPARYGNLHLDNSRKWLPYPGGPATTDLKPHDCSYPNFPEVAFGPPPNLPQEPKQMAPEQILKICTASGEGINWQAFEYDCPLLSHYRLFKNLKDSRINANSGGFKYKLNNELFSDYAEKDRFVFIPPGRKAKYQEAGVFEFPKGTMITKTFSFYLPESKSSMAEQIETRVLVHRKKGWEAVEYLWDESIGDARLFLGGKIQSMNILAHNKTKMAIDYTIPSRRQCASCHITDTVSGAMSPIGPKAKFLNTSTTLTDEGQVENQITAMARLKYLEGVPTDATKIPSVAVWHDLKSGTAAQRAQAYLEINCAHCHNPRGPAQNTGLYLFTEFEPNSSQMGYCRRPVAAGLASGGHLYDVHPGRPEKSILYYRMTHNHLAVKMPQLGRSVVHTEAMPVIESWIHSLTGDCLQ